uniref:DRBM domain-containing protein n=1 Tax=Anopheles maculatus TaxID=74869 RepID=A0A182SJ84_9DIPT
MEELGDSAVPDDTQYLNSDSVSLVPREPCGQYLDDRFFAYRNMQTPDACSEISEATIEDYSSYCASVTDSNFSLKNLHISKERKQLEKARKARQLHRCRKWLMPKNAMMALNEMQGAGIADMTVNKIGYETKVELLINNVRYEGTGRNKHVAKTKASELALRDLIFQRVAKLGSSQGTKNAGTEDLPIVHLASFAIHKLLDDWKKDGFELPNTIFNTLPSSPPSPPQHHHQEWRSIKTVSDLPPNAPHYHPTVLFAYMRPQIPFDDLGFNGDLLYPEFTAGLLVDGHYFTGKGRSKKLARKAAAGNACNVLFGVVFTERVVYEQGDEWRCSTG